MTLPDPRFHPTTLLVVPMLARTFVFDPLSGADYQEQRFVKQTDGDWYWWETEGGTLASGYWPRMAVDE